MERLDSGICVSVLKMNGNSICFTIYGVQKDSNISTIKENILHIAKEMTRSESPDVRISIDINREIPLESLRMEDIS